MNKRIYQAVVLGVAVFLLWWLAKPTVLSLMIGSVLVFCGEAIRIWASGHLWRNKELTTSGPYAHVRDPLYLGRLFLLVGFCVMGWGFDWILLIIGLAVFFFQYMPRKHRKEMARLERLFGQEYQDYSKEVKSLVPRIKPYSKATKRPWQFSLFWKVNREQYLMTGIILLSLALWWKLSLQ